MTQEHSEDETLVAAMHGVASPLDEVLSAAAGRPVAFVLLVDVGDTTHYVSNLPLPDGVAMLEGLLALAKPVQCAEQNSPSDGVEH